MTVLRFVVPGPPVPKARARVVRTGGKVRSFTPAKTARYERAVGAYALQARLLVPRWPLDASYAVQVHVYRAARRGDADNFLKGAIDGCNGVLWGDDRQVRRTFAELHDGETPRLEISVEVLT